MKQIITCGAILLSIVLAGCTSRNTRLITISNPTAFDRNEEMVEIPLSQIPDTDFSTKTIVEESSDKEIPFQITHDGKLIFQVSVKANGTATYTLKDGVPAHADTVACGKQYPERVDDIAWENDKSAYRLYGPALQARGEKAYGYDIMTKSVPYPVIEERYRMFLDPELNAQVAELREKGLNAEADSLYNSFTYHVDHGNGMDCYSVGETLGGGTAALLAADSTIIYPYCYKEFKILDNGPLRFTVQLTFNPLSVNGNDSIVETRILSLDKGSYLNRTCISYAGLDQTTPVAAGIALHKQNPDGYAFDRECGYIAYADSTDNPHNDNGIIYVGAAFPDSLTFAGVKLFDKERSGAVGHVLGISEYEPGSTYTFCWGSGWSKGDVESAEKWKEYLEAFSRSIRQPLIIDNPTNPTPISRPLFTALPGFTFMQMPKIVNIIGIITGAPSPNI